LQLLEITYEQTICLSWYGGSSRVKSPCISLKQYTLATIYCTQASRHAILSITPFGKLILDCLKSERVYNVDCVASCSKMPKYCSTWRALDRCHLCSKTSRLSAPFPPLPIQGWAVPSCRMRFETLVRAAVYHVSCIVQVAVTTSAPLVVRQRGRRQRNLKTPGCSVQPLRSA
jgi:hypothetical protein